MPVVYCASSLALACLEVFVHVDATELPDDLVAIRVELPEDAVVEDVGPLPRGWRAVPGPPSLRRIGSAWAARGQALGLRVPSAVIPEETNLLLNPKHPDMARVVRGLPRKFAFDPRMRPTR